MNQRTPVASLCRQRGAVVVVLGVTLAVLIGFAALAIDLGRTYLVRTELQNAADAAALAGAKELDQTAAGVGRARDAAIAIAAQHSFNFGTPVAITAANMWVGSCPEDACMVSASSITSEALASGKTFLKVDIPSGSLTTFFGGVVGAATTASYGRAVAGRYLLAMTPIGVCALKDATGTASRPAGEQLASGELVQYGFRRGASYNVFELGPLGTPSDPYLLNPADPYPQACDPSNSSANVTAPFICSGVSAVLSTTPGWVYGNTGVSAGKIEAALNSRFNIYSGASVCTPAQAPRDVNITAYTPAVAGSGASPWMSPQPSRQTMLYPDMYLGTPPVTAPDAASYGVLWSYSRAVQAVASGGSFQPGAAFDATTSAWSSLYPVATGAAPAPTGYPTPTATNSPYLRDSPASPPAGAVAERRVLNLAIADCTPSGVIGTGSCTRIRVLAVGRFFMQVPADFSGSPKKLQVEFAGLVNPPPSVEIKLYR